jgi:hypothetical protein
MCLGLLATAVWVFRWVVPSLRDAGAAPVGDGAGDDDLDGGLQEPADPA